MIHTYIHTYFICIYCQCPLQDEFHEKMDIVKKKAVQRLNTLSSVNLQKQAVYAIFRLATGNDTLGLQAW